MAGRRRDAGIDRRLLEEALTALETFGYSALSMRHVAERAGCTRAALSLRYETKSALVLAAVESRMASAQFSEVPDTGSLRGDLLDHAASLRVRFDLAGVRLLAALASEEASRDGVAVASTALMSAGESRVLSKMLSQAFRRDELDPATLSADTCDRVADLLPALIQHRVASNHRSVTDDDLHFFVDHVVIPCLHNASLALPHK